MNNKELLAELSQRQGLKNNVTQKLLTTVITTMADAFQEGNSVLISGFGSFEVKKKLERVIINPASGARMLVPPKLVLGFKASPTWKDQTRNTQTE